MNFKSKKIESDLLGAMLDAVKLTHECFPRADFNAILRGVRPEIMFNDEDVFQNWLDDWSEALFCLKADAPEGDLALFKWAANRLSTKISKLLNIEAPLVVTDFIKDDSLSGENLYLFVKENDIASVLAVTGSSRDSAIYQMEQWATKNAKENQLDVSDELFRWMHSTAYVISPK